jgi:NAD(P)-dependent dehydrogenase (short-subunit alcohol dehydrogenase family)
MANQSTAESQATSALPLSRRRALVVGGSGGIGAAVSEALAPLVGELVVHGGGDRARLDSLLSRLGPRARGVLRRLDSPGEVLGLLEEAGHPDILVLSYGPFVSGALGAHTEADWDRAVGLGLTLPGIAVSRVVSEMARRGFGRIVMFGGTRTEQGRGALSNPAYAAAKAGLSSLCRSVALGYGSRGVGAVLLCPGFVETEYQDESFKASMRRLSGSRPLTRPEELARYVRFFVESPDALFSGSSLTLDGGLAL